jgi:hypothetical protein
MQMFNNKSALYRHKQNCSAIIPVTNTTPHVINNTHIDTMIVNNNFNVTTNILTFPDDDDADFDFITNKISEEVMKKCVSAFKAEVGFNRFMGAILDHPSNRMVIKTNPNITYSKVHVGGGKWQLAPDIDVFPTLTHHMTVAALAKLTEFHRSMRSICDQFQTYVETINTDDECPQYQNTIQRLKLMVVNVSREIEQVTIDHVHPNHS